MFKFNNNILLHENIQKRERKKQKHIKDIETK